MNMSDLNDEWPAQFKVTAAAGLVNDFDKWPPVPGSGKIVMVIPGGYIRSDVLYQYAYVAREINVGTRTVYRWKPRHNEWEEVSFG